MEKNTRELTTLVRYRRTNVTIWTARRALQISTYWNKTTTYTPLHAPYGLVWIVKIIVKTNVI